MFTDTPSLRQYADDLFAKAYKPAMKNAATETGIARAKFPESSPWTIEQALQFEPPEPGIVD